MSRSFKKNPFLKYGGYRPKWWAKRQSSKAYRRFLKSNLDDSPPKGYFYRRIFNAYDVNDIVSYFAYKDLIEGSVFSEEEWFRWYYRK